MLLLIKNATVKDEFFSFTFSFAPYVVHTDQALGHDEEKPAIGDAGCNDSSGGDAGSGGCDGDSSNVTIVVESAIL